MFLFGWVMAPYTDQQLPAPPLRTKKVHRRSAPPSPNKQQPTPVDHRMVGGWGRLLRPLANPVVERSGGGPTIHTSVHPFTRGIEGAAQPPAKVPRRPLRCLRGQPARLTPPVAASVYRAPIAASKGAAACGRGVRGWDPGSPGSLRARSRAAPASPYRWWRSPGRGRPGLGRSSFGDRFSTTRSASARE